MRGFIMRTQSGAFYSSKSTDEPKIVLTDDGGSGLFEACKTRFAPPEYEVVVDARHTVWVKRTDGSRSFGLSPWLVRDHSLAEILDRVERRLRPPVEAR
jgi:hypothetical protein